MRFELNVFFFDKTLTARKNYALGQIYNINLTVITIFSQRFLLENICKHYSI